MASIGRWPLRWAVQKWTVCGRGKGTRRACGVSRPPALSSLLQTQNAQAAGWEMGPEGGWGSQHECLQWHGEDLCFTWPPLWHISEILEVRNHMTGHASDSRQGMGRPVGSDHNQPTKKEARSPEGGNCENVQKVGSRDLEILLYCVCSICHNVKWPCSYVHVATVFPPHQMINPLRAGALSLLSLRLPVPTMVPGPQQGFNKHVLSDRMTSVEIELMWLDKWPTRDRWEAEAVRCCGESFQLGPWKNVEHMAGLVSHISAYFLVYVCLWEMILSCQQLSSLLLLLLSLSICCFFF